jgi:hypothetical protein
VNATDNDETDPPKPQCSNGIDDDLDGKVDLADPGCVSTSDNDETDPPPLPAPQCSDGLDNDGDLKTDAADPGCASAGDNDETDPSAPPLPQCSNGVDDDLDGKTDFGSDPGCVSLGDNDEIDPPIVIGASVVPPPPPPPAAATPTAPSLLSPFPVVRLRGRLVRTGVVVNLLTVQVPAGARVTITCRGPLRSCPRARYTRTTLVSARLRFRSYQRSMRAGTILRIYVTKPGFVGKYTRFTIRRNKAPTRGDSCATPNVTSMTCP